MKKISWMALSFVFGMLHWFGWYYTSIFLTLYHIWDDGKEYGKHLQEKENNIINSIGEEL